MVLLVLMKVMLCFLSVPPCGVNKEECMFCGRNSQREPSVQNEILLPSSSCLEGSFKDIPSAFSTTFGDPQ